MHIPQGTQGSPSAASPKGVEWRLRFIAGGTHVDFSDRRMPGMAPSHFMEVTEVAGALRCLEVKQKMAIESAEGYTFHRFLIADLQSVAV